MKKSVRVIYLILGSVSLIFTILFFSNKLLSWDFPGHIYAIEYYSSELFPLISGWNPNQGLGYYQGAYYPSLIHYVIAFFNLFYHNTEFWIKLFFGITMISLPFSLKFLFTRIEKRNVLIPHIMVLITFLVILMGPSVYGGSLRSFSEVGLINNFYTLPFIFVLLGLILEKRKSFDFKFIIIVSFLLSILLSSHLVTGLISILILLSFWIGEVILEYLPNRKIALKNIFKNNFFVILVISFFTTLFFTWAYITNSKYTQAQSTIISDFILVLGFTILGLITIFGTWKLKFKKLLIITSLLTFFALLGVIEYVIERIGINIDFGSLHIYRLVSFSILLMPAISFYVFFKFFENRLNKFNKINLEYFILIGLCILMVIPLLKIGPSLRGKGDIAFNPEIKNLNTKKGNYLSLVNSVENYDFYRRPNYPSELSKEEPKFFDMLFAESSYLDVYGLALKKSLYGETKDIKNPVWPRDYVLSKEDSMKLLDLFDIDYLTYVSKDKLKYQDNCINNYNYATLLKPNDELINIRSCEVYDTNPKTYEIINSNSNWEKTNIDAFNNSNNKLFIQNYSNNNDEIIGKASTVDNEAISWYEDGEGFNAELNIFNDDKFLIFPVQYHPNWEAYYLDDNNKKINIEVFRVTPNLIAIEPISSKVYFNFKSNTSSTILTTLGMIMLFGLFGSSSFILIRKFQKLRAKEIK